MVIPSLTSCCNFSFNVQNATFYQRLESHSRSRGLLHTFHILHSGCGSSLLDHIHVRCHHIMIHSNHAVLLQTIPIHTTTTTSTTTHVHSRNCHYSDNCHHPNNC